MNTALETAREALATLNANCPDFCSPERAEHDAAVEAARQAFVAAKRAEQHAQQVAAAFGTALRCTVEVRTIGAGTQVKVNGRWHTVSRNVQMLDAYSARCTRTGNLATITRAGKSWKVQLVEADGYRYPARSCSTRASAMKALTGAL